MKFSQFAKCLAGALLLAAGSLCTAEELTGYEIAWRADAVDKGETSSYTATMTLTNRKGESRVREIFMRSKDYGDVKKSVIVFARPKDVAGVSYLSHDYPDNDDGTKKDSDSWLYMPAMKKVRRISGSGKDDDFMGTDFTYADMGDRGLTKDTFTLLGEDTVDGIACWMVESVAKDKSEKTQRRVIWYGKENYKVVKGEYYDKQNTLTRVLSCSGITKIDGIWTVGKMFMRNVKTDHTTLLELRNVKYNMAVDDNMFTVSAIEKGKVK